MLVCVSLCPFLDDCLGTSNISWDYDCVNGREGSDETVVSESASDADSYLCLCLYSYLYLDLCASAPLPELSLWDDLVRLDRVCNFGQDFDFVCGLCMLGLSCPSCS